MCKLIQSRQIFENLHTELTQQHCSELSIFETRQTFDCVFQKIDNIYMFETMLHRQLWNNIECQRHLTSEQQSALEKLLRELLDSIEFMFHQIDWNYMRFDTIIHQSENTRWQHHTTCQLQLERMWVFQSIDELEFLSAMIDYMLSFQIIQTDVFIRYTHQHHSHWVEIHWQINKRNHFDEVQDEFEYQAIDCIYICDTIEICLNGIWLQKKIFQQLHLHIQSEHQQQTTTTIVEISQKIENIYSIYTTTDMSQDLISQKLHKKKHRNGAFLLIDVWSSNECSTSRICIKYFVDCIKHSKNIIRFSSHWTHFSY